MMHAGDDAIERTHNVVMPVRPPCPVCRECIAKRKPHRQQGVRTSAAGQLTHADTWGPFLSAIYYEGCRYVVVFTDDYSRVKFPVFMRDRTSATLLEAWRTYCAFMRRHGVEPAALQSDAGPEYVSSEAFDFCDEHAV